MTRLEAESRRYPQTWLLLDVAEREPRLLGHEVVDLSPGAIELRHCARALRDYAEAPERWIAVREDPIETRLSEDHRRRLSFGPDVGYCVERDESRRIHGGQPFRHLALGLSRRALTPATSAEIGVYFYGRRPAVFGFTSPGAAHGFIGLGWEPLVAEDVRWLLERELRGG